jgi:hypothetical protein
MTIKDIVKRVNQLLAGETLNYDEMKIHLDSVMDDINNDLSSEFPVFSELAEGATEYTLIPDKYIRSVVCYGAAYYFYMTDEEGANPQPGYMMTYTTNKFAMKRDWIQRVPAEYEKLDDDGLAPFELGRADQDIDMEVFRL